MRYLILDLEPSPPLVVHMCDDSREAADIAQRYATQNARGISVFESKGAPKAFGPVALAALKFATPEDARRAGFPPSSGDEGK